MYGRTLAFVALLAVGASAQFGGNPRDPCQQCNEIVGYAQFWLQRNTNATTAQLQAELQQECQRLGQRERNQNVTTQCDNLIAAQSGIIYADLKNYINTEKICYDIKECTVPKAPIRAKRQAAPIYPAGVQGYQICAQIGLSAFFTEPIVALEVKVGIGAKVVLGGSLNVSGALSFIPPPQNADGAKSVLPIQITGQISGLTPGGLYGLSVDQFGNLGTVTAGPDGVAQVNLNNPLLNLSLLLGRALIVYADPLGQPTPVACGVITPSL